MSSPQPVRVSDHTLGLLDGDLLPFETGTWANGLVRVMTAGALIYTGIDRGYVKVALDLAKSAPATLDPGNWDEIIEVSVHSPHGDLRISSLEDGPDQDFPALSSAGPGTYRLRTHALGRDRNFDGVQLEPTEDYLIVCWPSPAQEPETVLRSTDRCGQNLRLAQASAARPRPPALLPELQLEQQQRAAQHQALLDAANQARHDF